MKKLLFVAIAFAGLTLVSCNKDQAAVKKLDGTWNVTSMKSDGTELISSDFKVSMTFNACKLKKDEWCTGSSTVTFAGQTSTASSVYRVTGDGTTLESKEHKDSTDVSSMTINELSKTNMKATQTDEFGGQTYTTVIEAEKQ